MGFTKINVGAVIGLSSEISRAQKRVSNIQSSFCSTYNRIDGQILARNQIGLRLSAINSKMSSVENMIQRVKSTVEKGAEKYQITDQKIRSWSNQQNAKASFVGNACALWASGGEARYSSEKASIEDESQSILAKFANNELKKDWASIQGDKKAEGSIWGINSAGMVKGSIWYREVGLKNSMSFGFDKENGKFSFDDFGISTKATALFAVAMGEAEGNWGWLHGKGEGKAITGAATAEAKFAFYDDGKFNPSASLNLKADGSVLKGKGELGFGTDQYGVYVKADGDVLHAEAKLDTGIGYIKKDESGNSIYGCVAKASAMASVAQGNAKAGFTLAGIDIDLGVKGYLLATGVEAGASISTEGVTASFAGALGLGGGLDVSIDWSDAKWVGDTIDTVGGFVKDGLEMQANAARYVGDVTENAGNVVGDFTRDVAQVVGDTAETVTDSVAQFVGDKVGDIAGDKVGSFAENVVEIVGDTTGRFSEGALEFVGNTAEFVGEGVGGFISGAGDLASDVGDFLFGWLD